MRGAVILSAANVAGGQKNAQIYFIKQFKKLALPRLKFKNFVRKLGLNKKKINTIRKS
jgi:hypothetical protein